jgi:subtilisin family serine protease
VETTAAEPDLVASGGAKPPRVVVLDTGLAPNNLGGTIDRVSARPAEPWGPSHGGTTDNREAPDENFDEWIDPASGHGTFISGLISRLAPTATVEVGRVLETTGEGDDADVAYRVEQLLHDPPDILCLSCSCVTKNDQPPLALTDAVDRLMRKGTVVVAAAGNSATSRLNWPAAQQGVVSVGALGPHGPAWFTNFGAWVSCCAPGVDVISNFFTDTDYRDDNDPGTADFRGWAKWSGTSFSAPIVAAAIARHMALHGVDATAAKARVIDDPRLFRIPGLGTVVNVH